VGERGARLTSIPVVYRRRRHHPVPTTISSASSAPGHPVHSPISAESRNRRCSTRDFTSPVQRPLLSLGDQHTVRSEYR
jgi:hypothetical protein